MPDNQFKRMITSNCFDNRLIDSVSLSFFFQLLVLVSSIKGFTAGSFFMTVDESLSVLDQTKDAVLCSEILK